MGEQYNLDDILEEIKRKKSSAQKSSLELTGKTSVDLKDKLAFSDVEDLEPNTVKKESPPRFDFKIGQKAPSEPTENKVRPQRKSEGFAEGFRRYQQGLDELDETFASSAPSEKKVESPDFSSFAKAFETSVEPEMERKASALFETEAEPELEKIDEAANSVRPNRGFAQYFKQFNDEGHETVNGSAGEQEVGSAVRESPLDDGFTKILPDLGTARAADSEEFGNTDLEGVSPLEEQEFLEGRRKKLDTFTMQAFEDEGDISPEQTQKGEESKREEIDDYNSPEDAKSVLNDLQGIRAGLSFRLVVTLLGSLALVYLSLAQTFSWPVLEMLSPVENPKIYLVTNLAILLLSALVCNKTIGGGIISLFTLKADNDSLCAVGMLASVVQCVGLVTSPQSLSDANIQVYAAIAELALLFNTVGKLLVVGRISRNFRLVSSEYPKYSVSMLEDKERCRDFTRGLSLEIAKVAYSSPTGFLSSFLDQSYSDDFSENVSKVLAPISLVGSIVVAGLTYFFTQNLYIALTALSAICAICSPFSATLVSNYPLHRVNKKLVKAGAFLSGYEAVEKFSETGAVVVNASELFGQEDVVLYNIKTFDHKRIDEVLLDAASVICSCDSTLTHIFNEVIVNNRSILKKVENIVYEDMMGISAWVDSKRVLIGNRELMVHHGIKIPTEEYEMRFKRDGRDILYLANSGEVSALFVLGYQAGETVAAALPPLADREVGLVVYSTDPNLTPQKISELFDYPEDLVKVMPAELHKEYRELSAPKEKATAGLGYTGGVVSYLKGIYGSIVAKLSITTGAVIQIIGVILAYAIIVFFAFNRSMNSLSFIAIFAYQLFWLLAVLVAANLKRVK